MKDGKLSCDEIISLATKLESGHYGPVREKWKDVEKFYELDFATSLGIPAEFQSDAVVLPTGRDAVDTYVDHIDLANARITVNKKGIANINTKEAEMMRKFYTGLLYRTMTEASISQLRVGGKHYGLCGCSVIKDVWDADRWPDKPIQKDNESEDHYAGRIEEWRGETLQSMTLPLVIQAIHPYHILADPSAFGQQFIIEKYDRLVLDVLDQWPEWKGSGDKGLGDRVSYISFWSKKWRSEIIDGVPVLPGEVIPHDYGFIPYVAIDSGLGNVSIDNDPKMRWVGILDYIRDVLISQSRSYSISEVILKRGAWPWGFLKGANAKSVKKISQKYGTYEPMPEGVEIIDMPPKVPPESLWRHLDYNSDIIAAHAAPRGLRGSADPGVRSAAQQRLLNTEGTSIYRYADEAWQHGVEKVLTNCAYIYKHIVPGDLRVWAKTPTDEFDAVIDKKLMKEPFQCYVEFAPMSDEDNYRQQVGLIQLKAAGLATDEWAWQQMSNVDPVAMKRAQTKERIKSGPLVSQTLDQYAAGKIIAAINKRDQAEALKNGEPPPMPATNLGQPGGTEAPQEPAPSGTGPRVMTTNVPTLAPAGSPQAIQRQMKKGRMPSTATQGQGVNAGGYK